MPVYKDKKNGTWYVSLWFTARDGSKKKKLKRGFAAKHEAAEYERRFHNQELGKISELRAKTLSPHPKQLRATAR